MNHSIKSTAGLFLVLVWFVVALGCGRSDQSTPRATMDTLKTAIQNEDWDRIYEISHPVLRGNYIHRWRSDLRALLKNRDTRVDVGVRDVDRLTNKQIFRTYLEIVSRDPNTRTLLGAYQSARYELDSTHDGTPAITINSARPLPISSVVLTEEDGQWLIKEVD